MLGGEDAAVGVSQTLQVVLTAQGVLDEREREVCQVLRLRIEQGLRR